ncbi:hypothetical protein [Corynebacterium sp.]|uniref:hypothetical protein n=1 Tax=Corynebacterium sp. TaxID=1720 RepID=UPI0026DCFC5E|nr:hypothetical protein [Corynebacterium sp.]MDO4914730.1 hypothetical protein [Corynebacterium sp.]
MPLYVISIIVLLGAVIGRILGLRIRMRENPELKKKDLKPFSKAAEKRPRENSITFRAL